MKYKLTSTDDFQLPAGITEAENDFNMLPTPFREATFSEYCLIRSSAMPRFIEHRQIMHDEYGNKSNPLFNTTIEWFFNCAFAIVLPNKWEIKNGAVEFKNPIRYFKIGCEHEYVELSQDECRNLEIPHHGKCWHVSKCEICQHVSSVDSSD